MQAADLDAFGSKQVTQHRAARKRKVHVQLVDRNRPVANAVPGS